MLVAQVWNWHQSAHSWHWRQKDSYLKFVKLLFFPDLLSSCQQSPQEVIKLIIDHLFINYSRSGDVRVRSSVWESHQLLTLHGPQSKGKCCPALLSFTVPQNNRSPLNPQTNLAPCIAADGNAEHCSVHASIIHRWLCTVWPTPQPPLHICAGDLTHECAPHLTPQTITAGHTLCHILQGLFIPLLCPFFSFC